MIWFADQVLGEPLDPWEAWLVIHAGELLVDGRPRFRTVLALVARQNGKTHLSRVLILYWLYVERVALILGCSTTLGYAKEVWTAVIAQAQNTPTLAAELGPKAVRATIGEEQFAVGGSRYRIAASNRRAGRSLTVHRLVLDELREHTDWTAWDAATNAMNAASHGQVWCITNQCDDTGVVLDSLRDSALAYLETGEGDPRLGIFEWSAPDGCDPTDPQALAAANPNLGHRVDLDALHGAALRAKAAGGQELASFRTEVLCQRVANLDGAIDMDRWTTLASTTPVDLAQHRARVACCLDVSLDSRHAALVAAAVIDGLVHVEVIAAWTDMAQLRAQLIPLVTRIRPAAFGWFPAGPAAAVASSLTEQRRVWPPRRVTVEAIRNDITAACMGLATEVQVGQIRHPDDPMLNAHLTAAGKLRRGDAWVFARRGAGPVNGAYAAAGAVYLARTLPPPPPPLHIA